MLLNEIFNSPYEYNWEAKTPTVINVKFRVKEGSLYEVQGKKHNTNDGTNQWDMEFSKLKNSKPKNTKIGRFIHNVTKPWNPQEYEYGLTKTGDSQKIFSTVINISPYSTLVNPYSRLPNPILAACFN